MHHVMPHAHANPMGKLHLGSHLHLHYSADETKIKTLFSENMTEHKQFGEFTDEKITAKRLKVQKKNTLKSNVSSSNQFQAYIWLK